jgi:hypothetical protein
MTRTSGKCGRRLSIWADQRLLQPSARPATVEPERQVDGMSSEREGPTAVLQG